MTRTYVRGNMTKEQKAQSLAYRARCHGVLKPQPCAVCGETDPGSLDMHHTDYDLAYLVTWLCRKCHSREHLKDRKQVWTRHDFCRETLQLVQNWLTTLAKSL